ncbi:hypothetical protein R84B8_00202 [Treponema sp. R8-4-B8]
MSKRTISGLKVKEFGREYREFFEECCVPRSDRGADGAEKGTTKPCRWIMWHSVALKKIPMLYKCAEPFGEAVAPGGINPASFCSSGVRCSAPGRLDFVHLHALNGVHDLPPPPPPPGGLYAGNLIKS